jgi:type IV secretion system protein VirD4
MLQGIERLFLEILFGFYSLPTGAGVALALLSAALLGYQYLQRGEMVSPGILGVAGFYGAFLHYFQRESTIESIISASRSFDEPSKSMTPLPLVEPLFSFFVAPAEFRSVWEEGLFVSIVVYLGFVVFNLLRSTESGGVSIPNPLSFLRRSGVARPVRSKTNELGSGDLASNEQIVAWTQSKGKNETVLNVTELRGNQGVAVKQGQLIIPSNDRNRHILTIAKTGGGKTSRMILPILYSDCLCPHRSTIILDSKPEMWRKLAAMTAKYNPKKKIMLFNPLDTARSLSWNILSKIEDDTDAKLIANTIIMATDQPQAKSDSPFFRNNALSILNAIMVGLLNDPKEKLSMPRIHELVQSGMKNLCDWIEAHPHALRTARTFVELARSGSQNADTIMSELGMRLSAWDLTAIRATTASNELDLESLIAEPTLFIIELRESEIEMLRPMANVIIVEILRFLTKRAEQCPGVSLPRPVGLVIDEFASSLGRLPDIHVKLNTLRSRNVSIVAAIQSIAQVKANYGDDADSVLAGFSTKILMPPLDIQDAEWASKETGQMTIRFKTASKGSNKKIIEFFASRNDGTQEQVQQRAVLTPDEIGRPGDNISTFFMPNTPVFQGHLVPYFKVQQILSRIEEFDTDEKELRLRNEPIKYEEKLPEAGAASSGGGGGGAAGALPAGISNTKGWTDEQILTKLTETKKTLDWDNTTGSARKWWEAFESENKHRNALVLRLAEELANRKATITEFFLAYVYSNTDNIQANLSYLDYTRLKKEEEKKKKEAAQRAKEGAGGTPPGSGGGGKQAAA